MTTKNTTRETQWLPGDQIKWGSISTEPPIGIRKCHNIAKLQHKYNKSFNINARTIICHSLRVKISLNSWYPFVEGRTAFLVKHRRWDIKHAISNRCSPQCLNPSSSSTLRYIVLSQQNLALGGDGSMSLTRCNVSAKVWNSTAAMLSEKSCGT